MKKLLTSISVVQKSIRTGLMLVITIVLLGGIYFAYSFWSSHSRQKKKIKEAQEKLEKRREVISKQRRKLKERRKRLKEQDRRISELHTTVERQKKRINRLRTQIRLLKVNRRVARLRVVDQYKSPTSNTVKTVVDFEEIDQNGSKVGKTRRFTVDGEIVYVDGWVVKFQDKYVQNSELPRSSSVILFHRIYGQEQSPEDGYQLDPSNTVPHPYRGKEAVNGLIEQIFRDFWTIANDQSRQEEMGIRAAHGTAGYIRAEPESTYRVSLRSSGDVSIYPVDVSETEE